MRRHSLLLLVASLILAQCSSACGGGVNTTTSQSDSHPSEPSIALPVKANSVRFAVIGDSGSGDQYQYEVAHEMEMARQEFPFAFVIMLGDNITGGHTPRDFQRKFEDPYKGLLDAGVKFYASLGNHDRTNESLYKPFNMGGKRYYSFKRGNVRFLALDSNYMDPGQLDWIKKQLQSSDSAWKICFFHHPLYSNGKTHGSDLDLRHRLEPIFTQYGVNVVFSGHDHVYERLKPQKGITYFVEGSSGHLRYHDLRRSPEMAAGFDTDRAFMLVEVAGNQLYFQAISRTGQTVDSGVLTR
ncbi:MAG TPA: metallophosphoesterase [Terriglobia bacterium]|nr:metallophosphoesterase [Terriglobia bacterium]